MYLTNNVKFLNHKMVLIYFNCEYSLHIYYFKIINIKVYFDEDYYYDSAVNSNETMDKLR